MGLECGRPRAVWRVPGLLRRGGGLLGGLGALPAWHGGGRWRRGSHFGVKGDLSGSWGSWRWRSGVPEQGVLLPWSQAPWGQRIQFCRS